jgi:hypothetical protein
VKLHNNLDARNFEAQNIKAQVLGGDPTLDSSNEGRFWYDSVLKRMRNWDGAAAQNLTNLVESVVAGGALSAVLVGKQVTLSIAAATGSVPGTMSAADKTKLDAATNGNTPSTLVLRDGSGNFAAGTITAALAGLAADSTLHGGASLASVRDFSLSTGQRTALSAISDFDTQTRLSRLDQMTAPNAIVSMNSQRLASLADPVNPQDGATKNYVDSVATGLDPKASVRFATTANLVANYANGSSGVGATLTATGNGAFPATDGVTVALNDRVLVRLQTSQPQNGIYRVSDLGSGGTPWVLTRVIDADSAAEITPGMFTFVEEGTTLAKTGWVLGSSGTTTVGTTNLAFTQFSGAGTYLAGAGLSLTGSSFAAVGTAARISVGATIDIDAGYVGQTSITTLGTVATGTWNATTIGVTKGGTGATGPVGARANLGATGKNAGDVPSLSAGGTYDFAHNLNSTDVIAALKEVATGDFVLADLKVVDANTVRLTSGAAIATAAYRIIVVG